MQMLRPLRRMFSNVKQFIKLQQLNSYLSQQKFSHVVVYFRANWNPNCVQSDQHIDQFARQNGSIQIIKVDSDQAPKIARHYGVKAEPQFVFCLWGDEVLRQIGPSYQGLIAKRDRMNYLVQNTNMSDIMPDQRWLPYGSAFEDYYRQQLIKRRTAYTEWL